MTVNSITELLAKKKLKACPRCKSPMLKSTKLVGNFNIVTFTCQKCGYTETAKESA